MNAKDLQNLDGGIKQCQVSSLTSHRVALIISARVSLSSTTSEKRSIWDPEMSNRSLDIDFPSSDNVDIPGTPGQSP